MLAVNGFPSGFGTLIRFILMYALNLGRFQSFTETRSIFRCGEECDVWCFANESPRILKVNNTFNFTDIKMYLFI